MKKLFSCFIIFFFYCSGFISAAGSDSLISALSSAKQDINKVYILLDIASNYADETDFPLSKKYAKDAILLSTEIKSEIGLMESYYELGRTEYLSANYPASIDNYFKSLKLSEKLKNNPEESKCLNAIGMVYYALEDFPKGIQYLNSSISASNDSSSIADSYTYLAGIYFNLQKYDSAQVMYQKASNIYEKMGSTANLIMCQQNMAGVYSRLGLKDKALEAAGQSLSISMKTNDPEQIAYAYFTIGFIASENEMYAKAITNFSKAMDEYKKLNDIAYIYNCHKGLSDCYYALGDSKNALEHYIKYIEIKDSTLNIEQAKEIARKEVLFQVEKKQYADSIVTSEKANSLKILNDEKIKRQTLYAYGGIAGFLVMLVLVLILFRNNRSKQKANELIAIEKKIVESQKNIIEVKQKEIIDSITYARRIQKSLLPTDKYIDSQFKRLKIDTEQTINRLKK